MNVNNNIYKYIKKKCVMMENMGLLLTGAGDLMAKDMGKTKILMLSLLIKFVFRNPKL